MLKGFNFKTHEIEELKEYKAFFAVFDYDEKYLNTTLNEGIDNLQNFMSNIIENIEENENYLVTVRLAHDESLIYDDYLSLFSTFNFLLTQGKGTKNDRGYLKPPEDFYKAITTTEFNMLYMLNNDFDLGTIQFVLENKKGDYIKWVN